MARVVQRRGSPPYLLILFVVLFLIATGLAVLFYVHDSDKAKLLVDKDKKVAKVQKERDGAAKDVRDLTFKITGRIASGPAGIQEADETLKAEHASEFANQGLTAAIRGMNGKIQRRDTEIGKLQTDIEARDGTIQKKTEEVANLKADGARQVQAVRKELADAKGRFSRDLAAKDQQLARATKEKDAIVAQQEQRITVLSQQKEDQRTSIQKLNARIAKLLGIIADMRGGVRAGELMVRQPDGEIIKTLLDENYVFINMGRKEGIKPGLSFAVYSRGTRIPKDGKGKAKIEVVNVGETTSDCRVVESARDDPIVEGDLIANVVFDTGRTHSFVLEGDFDLYGTGRPDPLGMGRIRMLIEEFGGKVVDNVSVSTDFVVLGQEPVRPPKPPDDAAPVEFRIYTEKLKKYQRYKQIEATARELQISILYTSRFLALSGYVPKKRLSD